jgi:hypothetical protein
MNTGAERLAFLLAASGLSERAIQDSLREVELLGADAVARRVRALRHAVTTRGSDLFRTESDTYEVGADRERDEVAAKVSRLLISEAQLSSVEAADRLRKALITAPHLLPNEIPAFKPKQGFRSWIRRVAGAVPPSELLHHASKIRNSAVHFKPSDWPLRERE